MYAEETKKIPGLSWCKLVNWGLTEDSIKSAKNECTNGLIGWVLGSIPMYTFGSGCMVIDSSDNRTFRIS